MNYCIHNADEKFTFSTIFGIIVVDIKAEMEFEKYEPRRLSKENR
ncbi:hypothetical protein [Psychrobacillus sp. OK032]|nr:hypothetical protein [Psychrobacillus sp. OK032]SES33990.1 hypothetical protein SAMN05518872_10889 [Psychrobacillus sp. OK032]